MMITVEVTQEDIDHGVKGNCVKCPIAKAIGRAAGNTDCGVGITRAHLYSGHERGLISFKLPIEAQNFIERFDDGFEVQPFSFDIMEEIPWST